MKRARRPRGRAVRILGRATPLAASLIFITVFATLPLAYFLSRGVVSGEGLLERFHYIFSSPYYRDVMYFTLWQATLSFLLTVLLSLPMAYLMARYNFPGKRTLLSLTTVPFILPPIVVAVGFFSLFGTKGYLNLLLQGVLGPGHSINILYSWKAIILAHVFYNFSIALRMMYSRLTQIDEEQVLVARSLGAPPWRAFLHVTLPQLLPAILSASLLVFIFCFMSFAPVLILGDGVKNITLEVALYRRYFFYQDYSTGGALAALEVLVVLLGTYLYLRVSSRWGENILMGPGEDGRSARFREAPMTYRALLLFYLGVSLFLMVGPLAGVVIKSFQSGLGSGGEFTLQWYRRIFSGDRSPFIGATPTSAIANSLIFALYTALLTVPLALLSGYSLKGLPPRIRSPVELYIMIPLGISGVVIALSLRVFYLKYLSPLTSSPLIIVIAHSLIAFPLALRIISTGLSSVDENLLHAARSLGASPMKTFIHVVLPQIRPFLAVAALFSFAISLGDFGATLVLYRPQYTTMPIAIYRFISAGRDFGSSYAFSAILIFIGFLCFYSIDRLLRFQGGKR